VAHDAQADGSFRQHGDNWLADIYSLARQRLQAAGVTNIHGGGRCTVSDAERYFSYRRDGVTGRMATLIWLEAPGG
jgi:copper oxidase (laccase) domain-containing protein